MATIFKLERADLHSNPPVDDVNSKRLSGTRQECEALCLVDTQCVAYVDLDEINCTLIFKNYRFGGGAATDQTNFKYINGALAVWL